MNWSAPRRIALAFMPMLTVLLFGALLAIDHNFEARPGQAGMALPAFVALGVVMLAIQQLHLWLAGRTVGR